MIIMLLLIDYIVNFQVWLDYCVRKDIDVVLDLLENVYGVFSNV